MEKIVSLCKRRGFVYPGSEIYGGLSGTWDYGPTGSLLKKNLKDLWWEEMVTLRDDIVGVDTTVLMHPYIWEAVNHCVSFADKIVECKICHNLLQVDKEKEIKYHEQIHERNGNGKVEWTDQKRLSTLLSTQVGVLEGKKINLFLRGEITPGVHVNFRNIVDTTRVRIPFGVAQIGRAFRNEIAPGNFVFRSIEFEQMEVQFYVKPDPEESLKWFEYWKQNRLEWHINIGFKKNHLRFHDYPGEGRARYAGADIEYLAPWGWDEMMAIHQRLDYDLSFHQKFSGKDLTYRDPETGETFIPYDIETSSGVDRLIMFLLMDSYTEKNERVILKLHPRLAPYKVAVFPLIKNKSQLVEKANLIYKTIKSNKISATFDDWGNIEKRYLAQDEIGTPWCVTVDNHTLKDGTVTVRDRDTNGQERVKAGNLVSYFTQKL